MGRVWYVTSSYLNILVQLSLFFMEMRIIFRYDYYFSFTFRALSSEKIGGSNDDHVTAKMVTNWQSILRVFDAFI